MGDLGLTADSAQEVLDGFVADVLLDNWDAGTGLDNIVVRSLDDAIARVDQVPGKHIRLVGVTPGISIVQL